MPESNTKPQLPFKFVGGFNLSTKTIGFILSAQGGLQVIAQMFVFPKVQARLGTLRTFRLVIFSYPILYWMIPYVTLMPTFLRYPAIFLILVWKVTTQAMSYPSNAIMLVNQAPSKKVLGTLNGFAASAASLARAIGPTIAGLIQAAGLNIGVSGLPWWTCAVVAILGACVSLFQQDKPGSLTSTDSLDEESVLGESLLGNEESADRDSFESTSNADAQSIRSVNTLVDEPTPELINLSH
jgi:MFS family permease